MSILKAYTRVKQEVSHISFNVVTLTDDTQGMFIYSFHLS